MTIDLKNDTPVASERMYDNLAMKIEAFHCDTVALLPVPATLILIVPSVARMLPPANY